MVGENLDTTSESDPPEKGTGRQRAGRRFVGMQFACCAVYARIYVNRSATAYVGNCPKCGKRVEVKIGPGGTDSRFFTAY